MRVNRIQAVCGSALPGLLVLANHSLTRQPGQGRRPSFYLICRHRWRSNQFQSILREKESSRSPCGDPLADCRPREEDACNGRTITTQLYRFQAAFSIGTCRQVVHGWSVRGRLCDPLIAFSGPNSLTQKGIKPARLRKTGKARLGR